MKEHGRPRVLMFGWDFPTQVSGGVGAACEGLVRALVRLDAAVVYVAPTAGALEMRTPTTLLAAHKLVHHPEFRRTVSRVIVEPRVEAEAITLIHVDSPLNPYLTVGSYRTTVRRIGGRPASVRVVQEEEIVTPPPEPVSEQRVVAAPHARTLPPGYGHDLFREVSRLSYLGRLLGESEEFDVIHAHDWMTFMAGAEAKLVSGKPLVVHVHSTEHDRTAGQPNPDIAGIERYGLRRADHVVVVSRRTRDRIVADYGIDPARITVVHNGNDPYDTPTTPPARAPGPPLVLFAGRVTEQKGPMVFVQAAERVLAARPDTRFVLAGAGDQLPTVNAYLAEHNLRAAFQITGHLEATALDAMFAVSTLYVMPSLAEPFGITPLQAAAHGVPTIVSSEAGVTEVMPSAIQVPPGDVDALADAMLHLLRNPGLARQVAAANHADIAPLSWDAAATRLMQVYANIVIA